MHTISAFISQFSRSMHVECWDKGISFLLLTKFDFIFRNNNSSSSTSTSMGPLPWSWSQWKLLQYDHQSLLHEYTCLIQEAMRQTGIILLLLPA